jgi:S1-C subfamily serine protease
MTLSLLVCIACTLPGESELLYFSAPWCHACQQSQPAIRKLESGGFPVRHINIDKRPDLARQFNIQTVPSLVLVAQGTVVRRVDRALSYDELVAFVRANTTPGIRDSSMNSPDRNAPDEPTTRSSESRPTGQSTITAERHALQASVRLRIEDQHGHSYGTGTVIDKHGSECLILTCGHIFRESRGRGRIVIHTFVDGDSEPIEGKLLRYDLDHDLALITARPRLPLQPVPVAGHEHGTARGERVFSVGCNHGKEPTIMSGRVQAINKYVGPPENIVVSGQPVDGRSGGGLFSSAGQLIGVCQAADPEYNEGLFAHLPAIHGYLDRANLAFVYARPQTPTGSTVATTLPPHGGSAAGTSRNRTLPRLEGSADTTVDIRNTTTSSEQQAVNDATEVVCIVRSKMDPSAKSQVVVLDRPSREFLNQLKHEHSRQDHRQLTELRLRARDNPSPRSPRNRPTGKLASEKPAPVETARQPRN